MSTAQSTLTGRNARTDEVADQLFDTLVRSWGMIRKEAPDGVFADHSEMREKARDPEWVAEQYGHERAFLVAAMAGEDYQRGVDSEVDELIERSAPTPESERAGPIDAGVVQAATPVEVDPEIVDIQSNAAPSLERFIMEAQNGFTAQFNVISDRSQPVGAVAESDAIDLSSNSDGDFTLSTETEDMKIYTDRVTLSDFTQRAEDSLGYLDVEETALGQRTAVYSRWKAGGIYYGDPTVGKSDGSIQDSNAFPGLFRIFSDADTAGLTSFDHVKDKSGLSTSGDIPRLEDLKEEVTEIVAKTGANYSDLEVHVGPEFYNTLENEPNTVVRLDDQGFAEDVDVGGRAMQLKNETPIVETLAVGRKTHGEFTYNETGGTPAGNTDINAGDAFVVDTSTVRVRELAPLFTVPLGRRGLADEAAMGWYGTLIDKSQGAHGKFLQGYPL